MLSWWSWAYFVLPCTWVKCLVSRATSCLSCSISNVTSCVLVSTTTSTQAWLHKGESKHRSLQEVEASSLGMSKIEFFFLGASVRVVPTASRFATLLVSSSQCLHLSASHHHVAFVQVMFATYWTTKLTLANTLVQFGLVDHQTPKSKVNGPRVHFPYNLPIFGDW